ncbi:MAG TPA: hypothetical protein VHP36_04095 [Chitinispirillaceae bacterium]|nr:hypothetical protein [Chitinispirillaceae bacterium]
MSIKNSLYSIITIVLLSFVSSYSQSLLGMQYPFGIPNQAGTGPSLSMGGTGIGVSNDYLGMAENPANLGAINRAIFSVHGSLDFTNLKEGGKETNHLVFNPHILSFCVPIKKFGTLGFSITQSANADAKYMIEESISTEEATESAKVGLTRKGSMSIWRAGWGYDIKRYAKIGLAYQRIYFNPITEKRKVIEGTINGKLLDSTAISFAGNSISGGVQVPIKKITLGMSGQYFFESDANIRENVNNTTIDDLLEDKPRNYSYTMRPAPTIGFGASYQISPEWLCAADFETEIWNKYISQGSEKVDNAFGFSVGGQYIPAPNLLTPKYYEIMQYRAGFRFNQLPVSTASEFGISLGVGLPLRQGGGLFDVFFEYGQRWDSNYKNNKEEFFKIQLGINAGRKWFQTTDTNY